MLSAAAAADWVDRATVSRPRGNLYLPTRWDPDSGLRLRFAPEGGAETNVVLTLTPRDAGLTFTPEDAFASAVRANLQTHQAALPAKSCEVVDVLVKFRPEGWIVYIERRPVLSCSRLLDVPVTVSQPEGAIPVGAAGEDTFFQPTAPFRFTDAFMVPEGEANALAHWEILSGKWELHTVIDDAGERKLLGKDHKKRVPIAAKSPNFYSLQASGTNAAIVTGYPFYDFYGVGAAMQVHPGEMGLLFHRQEGSGCFGFTLTKQTNSRDRVTLTLWRAATADLDARLVLVEASTSLTDGQWVRLGVRTFLNRVRCTIDGTTVFDLPMEVPAGGTFGLFADADVPVRFDDVAAASSLALHMATVADLERYTLRETGRLLPRRRERQIFPEKAEFGMLRPATADELQELILGSPDHPGHVFATTVTPEGATWEAGLIAGYRSEEQPYYRFIYRRDEQGVTVRLEEAAGASGTRTREEWSLPAAAGQSAGEPVTMMCDASDGRVLRLYLDDRLVLVHHRREPLVGASGVYVGPDSKVAIEPPTYIARRTGSHHNRFEKNRQFIKDPFMRHWSSPEGQWITLPDKTTWYKGDFFGRFDIRLPCVPNSAVHLGVGEGQTNGAIVLRASATNLSLDVAADTNAPAETVWTHPRSALPVLSDDAPERKASPRWHTLHYENHWFWITSGTNVLFKTPLAEPLRGTRVRLAGFTAKQLTFSKVDRYSVRDCLFTESLQNWIVNGGQWEVINRFACHTEWSHMNGESRNNLAALWSKYRFAGDFCLEMYAGIRHGWYDRCGDMNVTVMNRHTTPSEGYTVTCTGWDRDHSQRYTRLFRDGELLAKTDAYLVPRHREGNKRRGYTPLVAGGRDVHGAWYYIKLRRVDGRLQYFFDNEKVFDVADTRPLDGGSFGIWTFMNSMMVARVKMAAERITRRPLPIAYPDDAETVISPPPAAPPAVVAHARYKDDAAPLALMAPSYWGIRDDVGQSSLHWLASPDGTPCFVVTNVLGSGAMHAFCDAPPSKLANVAGWTFEVKRTPGAMFNVHYSIGQEHPKRDMIVKAHLFHQLSGAGFSEGAYRLVDSVPVPPVQRRPDWPAEDGWTRVTVWIDVSHCRETARRPDALVRFDGFGNLQPSDVMQGLKGNRPGEAYAVRNVAEIRYGAPVFQDNAAGATNAITNAVTVFAVRDRDAGNVQVMTAGLRALEAELAGRTTTGVHATLVDARADNRTYRLPLRWVTLPTNATCDVTWSPVEPETLLLGPKAPYRDPRLLPTAVSVNGVAAPIEPAGRNRFAVPVPRDGAVVDDAADTLTVAIQSGARRQELAVALAGQRNRGPALLALEGFPGGDWTFETRAVSDNINAVARARLVRGDAEQGAFLELANAGKSRRLRTTMTLPSALSLAAHPLLQFRYRAVEMAPVSLRLGSKSEIGLGEKLAGAVTVRGAGDLIRDGQWHTWHGVIADAMRETGVAARAVGMNAFTIGSLHKVDQTGLFARLGLDDVLPGPAVSPRRPLRLQPRYVDLDGVRDVQWAFCEGATPYHSRSEETRNSLTWHTNTPGSAISPDLRDVAEGIAHVALRAVDAAGYVSPVTDVPVLVDRTAPTAEYSLDPTGDPLCNASMLQVTLPNGGGAPLDVGNLTLTWNGARRPIRPHGSSYRHTSTADKLELNWPLLLCRDLDRAQDGQTNTIVLGNITDGAGNTGEDLVVRHVVDYAADKTPPTMLRVTFPANVLLTTSTAPSRERSSILRPVSHTAIKVGRDPDCEPYFRLVSRHRTSGWTIRFSGNKRWRADQHPFVAMRMRQPDGDKGGIRDIELVFKIGKLGTRRVSLIRDLEAAQGKRFRLASPLDWRSDNWHAVTIDMRRLLRQEVDDDLSKYPISAMTAMVTQQKKKKGCPVDFQSLFVFGDWDLDSKVTLAAFDTSGIAGTSWSRRRRRQGLELSPLRLLQTDPDTGWMVLTVDDKAGNTSVPLRIPVFDARRVVPHATQQTGDEP